MAYSLNPKLPRVRMEAVKLTRKGWSARKVARYTGFSPSTVTRWIKIAPADGRSTIPTKSSRPRRSPRAIAKEIKNQIIIERLTRNRCAEVVQKELSNRRITVSLSTVKRTLDRYGLTKKKSPWKRLHYSTERPKAEKPGVLLQIDTIHFRESTGRKFYAYTLIDLNSRWGCAKLYGRINPKNSWNFVREAMAQAPFAFDTIQSDHGQEFSTYFTFRLERVGIIHRHSRVRKPNDNAHVERFNRTLKDECFGPRPKHYEVYQKLLPPYLEYYNNRRLHFGLNLETPAQVLRRC